jgi:hypothetical protein
MNKDGDIKVAPGLPAKRYERILVRKVIWTFQELNIQIPGSNRSESLLMESLVSCEYPCLRNHQIWRSDNGKLMAQRITAAYGFRR